MKVHIQNTLIAKKRLSKHTPNSSVHFLDIDHITQVFIINIHPLGGAISFVVRDDVQPIVWSIEPDLHHLSITDAIREEHHRERVQDLALYCPIQRPRAIICRIPDGHEILFGRVVDVQCDLPVR